MGVGTGDDDKSSKLPSDYFWSFINVFADAVDKPVTWFRDTVVTPNRPVTYWYHKKFRRVPTIDQCYRDDKVCFHEADEQWNRDRRVDSDILNILRSRWEECAFYENPDQVSICQPLKDIYDNAAADWFTKYGDLGPYANVVDCYMKQKHRLIWERRHGPVGSGMRPREQWGTPFEPVEKES